jgi:ribulose 1,5-bisphosphate synthetase/thiazole synthase
VENNRILNHSFNGSRAARTARAGYLILRQAVRVFRAIMNATDVVIVGSGINSLVCGALLAKRGLNVCVLERDSRLGGCIRADELSLPGFRHDTLSTLYPLLVTAPM